MRGEWEVTYNLGRAKNTFLVPSWPGVPVTPTVYKMGWAVGVS